MKNRVDCRHRKTFINVDALSLLFAEIEYSLTLTNMILDQVIALVGLPSVIVITFVGFIAICNTAVELSYS